MSFSLVYLVNVRIVRMFSSTISDENLVGTENADTSKNTVKDVAPLDIISTNHKNVNPGDSTGLIFIRMFYEEYLLGLEDDSAASVKRIYCTSGLIEKLANKKLDYDPFLNAQDFDDNLLKTLDVKKSNDPQGYYIVSYLDGYSKKKVYIVMKLTGHEREYKISDVILGFEPEKK